MKSYANKIDVHHHLIPPDYCRTIEKRGLTEVAGAPLPSWTVNHSIEVMDANGIGTAITSVSSPGVYFGDQQEAKALARSCNEFAAQMRADHPDRFGSFAVLPMPFTELACTEAVYALDILGADGVVLLASTEGIFLGDPSFDELMAELNRRKTTVFIHPNLHPSTSQIKLNIPHFMIEFLCDTTRAATNLILSGTMARFPDIRWILAHAGGFLPFIAWRIALADNFPEFREKAPEGVLSHVRKFYFDTALSPSPFAMAALKELVDPTHILFGSDFPFAPAPLVGIEVESLSGLNTFNDKVKAEIDRENALRLFPKYRLEQR